MELKDTICALATPQGGALGVIRISGSRAIDIAEKIFTPRAGMSLADRKAPAVVFGDVYNDNGELLDEVLLTMMRAPRSYTGEDTVEISCHASPYIIQQLLLNIIDKGARQAEPGEYTMRAFLNGKMDLSRAEAVADLIASESEASHRLAMNQLKGGFSKELSALRDKLLRLTSLLELELDFSEEDVTFADRKELMLLCEEIDNVISSLVNSFGVGNAVRNGLPVAIVGETNTGKSTLLNALLREERALVSNISGTTRDTVEGNMSIGGVMFRFIDTAGIRETEDVVEQMGIKRTFDQLCKATIALWVIDPTTNAALMRESAERILPICVDKKLAILINKCDIVDAIRLTETMKWAEKMVTEYGKNINWDKRNMWAISAKLGVNVDKLEDFLIDAAAIPSISSSAVVVTNVRHYEALKKALQNIKDVRNGLNSELSGDLVSEDLRACLSHLSEILGEMTSDEVLGNIFKTFCIGK